MSHVLFDRSNLRIEPLSRRKHDLSLSVIRRLEAEPCENINDKIREVARDIIRAKKKGASVILMMGAHVLRSGVQNYLIDLLEKGYISCIALNGAGIIHDFEFASIGATTESVAHYIKEGYFGLWKETAELNDIINSAYQKDKSVGMGEAVGRYIENSGLPYKSISILAVAYRLGIPVTVHVGIGYDIIHEHSNCDGASTGALSYNDFLKFASVVQGLENGVVMNFGSAVMAPEVFLKALSMARNVAHQRDEKIEHFTTLVCDIVELPEDTTQECLKDDPKYYFRPLKTMLVRAVSGAGKGFYVRGRHGDTIPALWSSINFQEAF